jgi:hypothetical protein
MMLDWSVPCGLGSKSFVIRRSFIVKFQTFSTYVLKHADLSRFIDFAEPVRISMMCVTCLLTDTEHTHIMSSIQYTICHGSYVVLTHNMLDGYPTEKENIVEVQKTTTRSLFHSFSAAAERFCEFATYILWNLEFSSSTGGALNWIYLHQLQWNGFTVN